ncbi:MAG: hypothetical protein M1569_04020 [Candidatus Marsarchaeota archaeon]|nr:hypothetical protein [Candidatus Marsarchaeota archaeon]MCL5413539.1 hypothetical protein [Candidatus Marsarchaeota archaeon]
MPAFSAYDFSIVIAVLSIMIAIGGIALGLGYAMNSKPLKEFGKDEIYQSLINGVMVGGLIALFMPSGIITTTVNSIASPSVSAQCPSYLAQNAAICFSYAYLSGAGYTFNGVYHSSVLSLSTMLMAALFALNTVLGLLASVKMSILLITFSPSAILAPILNQIQFFIKALTTASLSAYVQSSILSAIAVSSLSILLPLGIMLRTFYPSRKLGGFMIATVIGLYVVFPLTYIMDANILNSYSTSISNASIVNMTNQATSLNGYVSGISVSDANGSFLSKISDALKSLAADFSSLANQLMEDVAYFIMAAFILPAFSIVLTSISIKEFSGILGSEINFNIFDAV